MVSGDNRSIRRAKLQSNRHQQQTNTQLFTGRMPFLSSNQHCQSIEALRLLLQLSIERKHITRRLSTLTALASLHCALASCGAVYCNRSCLWV